MSSKAPIVCLCHLVWEKTLFQRPQQLMTRMARLGHPTFFLSKVSSRRWVSDTFKGKGRDHRGGEGNLTYHNSPWIPLANKNGLVRSIDRHMVMRTIKQWTKQFDEPPILWVYHPDIIEVVDHIPHQLLVFDVMDPYRAFKQSRPDVVEKEERLLKRADVVFTGGVSMHQPVAEVVPEAHCFSSGVQLENFAKARDASTPIADDLKNIPGKILGYFGAVDERMDFETMREICRRRPDWSLVILGPLLGGTQITIDEPNFHWLGPKAYDELPTYLKGFDVCLIPWVKNELTDNMSPTKTPEYLAGGKPVVSIPIKDVVGNYGDISLFATTPDEWITACEQAMDQADKDWAATIVDHPHARTWEQIAQAMDEIISASLRD